jgi:hypothetical protein
LKKLCETIMGVSNTIYNITFGLKLAKMLLVKLKDRGYKTLQFQSDKDFFPCYQMILTCEQRLYMIFWHFQCHLQCSIWVNIEEDITCQNKMPLLFVKGVKRFEMWCFKFKTWVLRKQKEGLELFAPTLAMTNFITQLQLK